MSATWIHASASHEPGVVDDWALERFEEFARYQPEFEHRLRAAGLHFEGKPYPVSLRPLLVPTVRASTITSIAETFVPLMERVADIYRSSVMARSLFPVYQTAEPLITALPPFQPLVQICRIDGGFDEHGEFQIFETGADGPGGVIQNGMTGRLWLEAIRDFGLADRLAVAPQPLVDEPDLFVRQLLEAHAGQFGTAPGGAAVVNLNRRWTNEVDWMAKGLCAAGVAAEVVDAAAFRRQAGKLITPSGLSVTLTYNKPEQNDLVTIAGARPYLESAACQEIACVNPLIAYLIIGDKATLAVLSDPRFAEDFTSEERSFLGRHLPWTRFVQPVKTTDHEGTQVELAAYLLDHREDLVLKPINLTRGQDTLIGSDTEQFRWEAAAATALAGDRPYVAQRRVRMPHIDVPTRKGGRTRMVHGLDIYVFGGTAVGFQCRASLDSVINIGKRGTLLPPVVVS